MRERSPSLHHTCHYVCAVRAHYILYVQDPVNRANDEAAKIRHTVDHPALSHQTLFPCQDESQLSWRPRNFCSTYASMGKMVRDVHQAGCSVEYQQVLSFCVSIGVASNVSKFEFSIYEWKAYWEDLHTPQMKRGK